MFNLTFKVTFQLLDFPLTILRLKLSQLEFSFYVVLTLQMLLFHRVYFVLKLSSFVSNNFLNLRMVFIYLGLSLFF